MPVLKDMCNRILLNEAIATRPHSRTYQHTQTDNKRRMHIPDGSFQSKDQRFYQGNQQGLSALG